MRAPYGADDILIFIWSSSNDKRSCKYILFICIIIREHYLWTDETSLGCNIFQWEISDSVSCPPNTPSQIFFIYLDTYLIFVTGASDGAYVKIYCRVEKIPYWALTIAYFREGLKKRPVFVVFDYEGVRTPPLVVPWESEIFWSIFLLWWMP